MFSIFPYCPELPFETGVYTQRQDTAEVVLQDQFSGGAAAGRTEGAGHEGIREHGRIAVGIEVQHQEAVHRSEDPGAALEDVVQALVQLPALSVRAAAVGGRVEDDAVETSSAADLTDDVLEGPRRT